MRKTFFIINPDSGHKTGLKLKPQIEALWQQAKIDYRIYVTSSLSDIATGVGQAVEENASEIVIVGGDGTIHAAVNTLGSHPIPIGVIPCGTGNDFARFHGIDLDVEKALKTVLNDKAVQEVDLANCNGSHFLNVASIGIDAAIVKRTQRVKRWLRGPLAYLVSSIIEILIYEPKEIRLTVDGVTHQRTVELVAVANGRFYGGGMDIAPMANSSDGLYDVILIRQMKKRRLLRLLTTAYSGTHIGEPEVETFIGKNIQIQFDGLMDINLDGELTLDRILSAEEIGVKIRVITKL